MPRASGERVAMRSRGELVHVDTIEFHASVASVAIAGDRLRLTFAKGESPLDQGAGACTRPPTDPLVKALLAAKRTTLAPPVGRGRGRGKARGGGRGGKGRRGGGKGKKG